MDLHRLLDAETSFLAGTPAEQAPALDAILEAVEAAPRRSSEPDIAEPFPGAANKDGYTE